MPRILGSGKEHNRHNWYRLCTLIRHLLVKASRSKNGSNSDSSTAIGVSVIFVVGLAAPCRPASSMNNNAGYLEVHGSCKWADK